MKTIEYCLVETSLGPCAVGWSQTAAAVRLFQLPEKTAALTESRIKRFSGAQRASNPPATIVAVMQRVSAHLNGEWDDFRDMALDLGEASPFARRVYEAARAIPVGQTVSYGELARAIGRPLSARAVGQCLGRNPIALIIPCHRVLAAGGKPGGFSAYGGTATKARMLAIEAGCVATPL